MTNEENIRMQILKYQLNITDFINYIRITFKIICTFVFRIFLFFIFIKTFLFLVIRNDYNGGRM
jgi:hypothetical protein